MKSRKIISLLSAAAMSASVFSGLALTAHAEDTVLWSNSFDGYQADTMLAFVRKSGSLTDDEGWRGQIEAGNEPFYSLYQNNVQSSYVMTNAEGNSLTIQCGTNNIDDTGIVYSRENMDGDNYLSLPKARFSNKNGAMQLSGFDAYSANEGEDLLVAFKLMMTPDSAGTAPAISIGNIGTLTIDTTNIQANTWYDVRVVVPASGDAAIYVEGSQVATTAEGSLDTGFVMAHYEKATKCDAYATVNIDELVIMSVAAGTGATASVPAAEDIQYVVPEGPKGAPSITLPEGATQSLSQNFNSYSVGTLISMGASDQTYTELNGVSIAMGSRDDGDASSYAAISEVIDGDMALNLTSGRFSNGSKGPIMSLNNNLALKSADSPTSVMAFAVKLSSTGTVPGKLYLLDNSTNLDGNDVARDRLAVLSTEEDVSGYLNGETPIGIHVDAEEWYSVVVTVNPNADAAATTGKIPSTYRVFVFDSEGNNLSGSAREASISAETVNKGDTATSVNNLPELASAQESAEVGPGNAQIALIDNLITYTTTSTTFDQNGVLPVLGEPAEPEAPAAVGVTMKVNEDDQTVSLTATTAGSAVLVQASYNTAKVLSDINVVPVSITVDGIALSASGEGAQLNAFTRGDKFMVFDSLADLTPLFDAHTVVNGAEPVEPETYGITVTTPVNGTVTTDPSGSAEAGDTVTITASPAEGYEVDTITVTAADQSTVTVTDNEFTMPAQAVTVTVTFKEASTQPDDPDNEYAAALVHTGYITSGTSMGTAGVSVDTADGNELFNSWGGGSSGALYGQTAYAQFEFDDSAPTNNIASIDFTFTVTGASDDTQTRSINVYLMPADFPSLENATIESANLGSLLGSVSGSTSETKEFTFKITDPTVISDIMENKDQVIIGVSDRNKGGTLSGLNSQTPPTLTIVQGEQVTLTTKVDGTATAGVTVAIDGVNYVSNENGVISLYLPVGTHTYAVEGGTYEAISATNFNVAADTGYTADINLTVSTVVAVPDRALPTGVTQLHEVASTTAQGNSTVLLPTAAREGIGLPETLTADYTFTIDYDIYIPVNASISLGAQNADRLGTMFNFTADSEGKLTVTATESGSSTKTVSDALSAGKWYNVKVVHTTTTANDGNFTTGPMTITISDVDIETGTVGSAVATLSDIAARNNVNGDEARAYNSLNFSSVTGNVMLNNIYVYTADTATD